MPGAQGPKTVKWAYSDPNYGSRLLLDCVPVFHKIITPTYLLNLPSRTGRYLLFRNSEGELARSECLPGGEL